MHSQLSLATGSLMHYKGPNHFPRMS